MRKITRSTLVAVLVASLCNLSSFGSSEKPLGVIAQAEHARLDSVSAAIGATVYAGDSFDTETGGMLRLRVGASQLYMLASSAATLAQNSSGTTLTVTRGTAGFSLPAAAQLALDTPAGLIRGKDGKPSCGQVTIKSPNELVVSAFRGDLLLDNEGEFHAIPEGKSYRFVVESEAESRADDNKDFQSAENHHRKRRIVAALIIVGVAAVASYALHQELSESPTKLDH